MVEENIEFPTSEDVPEETISPEEDYKFFEKKKKMMERIERLRARKKRKEELERLRAEERALKHETNPLVKSFSKTVGGFKKMAVSIAKQRRKTGQTSKPGFAEMFGSSDESKYDFGVGGKTLSLLTGGSKKRASGFDLGVGSGVSLDDLLLGGKKMVKKHRKKKHRKKRRRRK